MQSVGKGFHHNEIFRRTKPENRTGLDFYHLRTSGGLLFKRQGSQCYVYASAFGTLEKQNPVLEGERSTRFYRRFRHFQKRINATFLATKAREKR